MNWDHVITDCVVIGILGSIYGGTAGFVTCALGMLAYTLVLCYLEENK